MRLRSTSLVVGLGLAVFGASSYAYLAVAARRTSVPAYSDLSLLWVVTMTAGIGLFLPLEQELARVLAARRGRDEDAGAGVVVAAQAAAVLIAAVLLLAAVLQEPLARFLGSTGLVWAAALGISGQGVAYLVRGVTAGSGQFGVYAWQLAVEGGLRVVAAGLLAENGVHDVLPYAVVLGAASVVSAGVTVPAVRHALRHRGPRVGRRELSRSFGWLVLATLFAQLLANAAPVLVRYAGGDEASTGRFFSSLLVARVPLFLFAAVQAVLLPSLSRAIGAGDRAGFRVAQIRVERAVAVFGLVSLLVAATIGVPVVRLLFGARYALDLSGLVLLVGGAGVYLLASTAAQAALALGWHRRVALGWAVGCGSGALALLLPAGLTTRAACCFLIGAAMSATVLLAAVHDRLAPVAVPA